MLRLAVICVVAFGFIAGVYSVLPAAVGSLSTELSFAIAFVVEFMAIFSVAIGWVIYDTTRRQQLLYIALGLLTLFIGDGVGLIAPVIVPYASDGWWRVLLSDISWFGMLTRVVAGCFFLASVVRANWRDNLCRNEQIWVAMPVVFAGVVVLQFGLSVFSPLFGLDVSHVFEHAMMLPLLMSTLLMIAVLSGYLQRMIRRPTAFEVLFTGFLINSVYHHMAFVVFDVGGRDITRDFLMPSRLLSYGLVLVAMVAALRDLYRSASQSSSAKSAFLATMSHEIRTPLNGVLGMAQLLRQSNLDGIQRERVDGILSSGRALMSLLNDILDMSKIEAGHAEIENRPFRPFDITCDLSNAIVALTQEKNLKLVWDDKVLRNKVFIGDEVRFRQILWNLLSNAVKFTSKGSIHLVVEHDSSRAGGRIGGNRNSEVYRFSVIDTGIGIAPERQARIFQAFTQGDNSTMRQFGGTGLGLSISQSLIAMMGGHIGLHSVPVQGTRFDCWLPFDVHTVSDGETGQDLEQADENTGGILAEKRVLVVEDNEINANVIQAFLERWGLQVDIVGNGRLAVQAFEAQDYDAILMDAHMPVLDGEGATRHIRELERSASGGRIPIIGVTADAFADRQRDFLAAGMDEVLTKPIEERRLYASLIHHLRGRESLTRGLNGLNGGNGRNRALGDLARAEPVADDKADIGGAASDHRHMAQPAFASARPLDESRVISGAEGSNSPEKQQQITPGGAAEADQPRRSPSAEHPQGPDFDHGDGAKFPSGAEDMPVNTGPVDIGGNVQQARPQRHFSAEKLVNLVRLREMQDALGTDQMVMLIEMLPGSYQDERTRMVHAIESNDTERFRRSAHSLKGMAANLAADELAKKMRELEKFDGDLNDIMHEIAPLDELMHQSADALLSSLQ
ncbi:sensor histidine kinase [Thalassospira mesophila]|uniref:sensor histidine kinase n=1 Tax=Thalassospira mesophila TaxID=1293891 RepID=UPI000A1E58DC|nr:sensor histidine kinase [Thalassospira mesophila]